MECTNRTSENLRAGKSKFTMLGPSYTEQTPGSQCQRNRQRAGHLHHKALHPSPIHANIRSPQERRSLLLHSHHHLAESILLLSRHAGGDLYMYSPAQNLGTLDSRALPRYLQGRLCVFNNECRLRCHDFTDSSFLYFILADAFETKDRHLRRLCYCDLVSDSPRH